MPWPPLFLPLYPQRVQFTVFFSLHFALFLFFLASVSHTVTRYINHTRY